MLCSSACLSFLPTNVLTKTTQKGSKSKASRATRDALKPNLNDPHDTIAAIRSAMAYSSIPASGKRLREMTAFANIQWRKL